MNNTNITGSRISQLRKNAGLGMRGLGERIGVDHGSISKWESGKIKYPSVEQLITLAKYFNVTVDYLLGLTEYPYIDKGHLSKDEASLISDYRCLDDSGQDNIQFAMKLCRRRSSAIDPIMDPDEKPDNKEN